MSLGLSFIQSPLSFALRMPEPPPTRYRFLTKPRLRKQILTMDIQLCQQNTPKTAGFRSGPMSLRVSSVQVCAGVAALLPAASACSALVLVGPFRRRMLVSRQTLG